MPLYIVRQDITKMQVDAIVNAANHTLLGGGGVDGAIHLAAGQGLLAECRTLGGCETGKAKITAGYDLPARHVIHTVGPVWRGGGQNERELLASCYRSSMELALEKGLESIAFPLISAGAYGYPKGEALRVALGVLEEYVLGYEITVYLVIFDKASFALGSKLFADIAAYIDDGYALLREEEREQRMRRQMLARDHAERRQAKKVYDRLADTAPGPLAEGERSALYTLLEELDESFSRALLRLIDEKGMTDVQCYKKANVDRKHFSKIRKDEFYRPSKPTVLAFAIALELDLRETEALLKKAGFALSSSSRSDLIVKYFIQRGNYNIFEINEALFAFDQSVLGA
ncbi:MAG: macro domain-containing protein [Clostridia bacterium]|nr:macro domain-containing protein [Clostridia bacterium]